jgi:hypothetical protein
MGPDRKPQLKSPNPREATRQEHEILLRESRRLIQEMQTLIDECRALLGEQAEFAKKLKNRGRT